MGLDNPENINIVQILRQEEIVQICAIHYFIIHYILGFSTKDKSLEPIVKNLFSIYLSDY